MTTCSPVARAIAASPLGSRPIPMQVASTMVAPPACLYSMASSMATRIVAQSASCRRW